MPLPPKKLTALLKKEAAVSPVPLLKKKAEAAAAAAPAPEQTPAAPKAIGKERAPGFAKQQPKAAEPEREVPVEQLIEDAAGAAEQQADEELEMLLPDLYKVEPGQPPEWVKDPELWQQALDAVGVGALDEDKYEEPLAVAAYLYKAMGGPIEAPGIVDAAEAPAQPSKAPAEKPAPKPAQPAAPDEAAAAKVTPKEVRGAAGKLAAAKAKAAGKPGPAEESPADEAAEGPAHEAAENPAEEMVEQAAAQAETSPDPELTPLINGYDPQRDGPVPGWAQDADKWQAATKAVDPQKYPKPVPIIAHLYKAMGGTVATKSKPAPAQASTTQEG